MIARVLKGMLRDVLREVQFSIWRATDLNLGYAWRRINLDLGDRFTYDCSSVYFKLDWNAVFWDGLNSSLFSGDMCSVHARINIHGGPKDIMLVIGFVNVELSARAHMLLSHPEIDFERTGAEVNY